MIDRVGGLGGEDCTKPVGECSFTLPRTLRKRRPHQLTWPCFASWLGWGWGLLTGGCWSTLSPLLPFVLARLATCTRSCSTGSALGPTGSCSRLPGSTDTCSCKHSCRCSHPHVRCPTGVHCCWYGPINVRSCSPSPPPPKLLFLPLPLFVLYSPMRTRWPLICVCIKYKVSIYITIYLTYL